MVFFVALLHSIIQYPQDYFKNAISNCKGPRQGFNAMISSGSTLKITDKNIDKVMNTISKRIEIYYPTQTEEETASILKSFEGLFDISFWTGDKEVQIFLNGYNAENQNSFFLVFLLSRKEADTNLFSLRIFVANSDKVTGIEKNILSIKRIEIKSGKIDTIVSITKEEELDRATITVLAEPLASLVNGYGWTADLTFFQIASAYLQQNLEETLKQLPYIKLSLKEVEEKVNNYIKNGIVDLKDIQNEIIRICSITPTPIPEPEGKPKPKPWKFWEEEEENKFGLPKRSSVRKLRRRRPF